MKTITIQNKLTYVYEYLEVESQRNGSMQVEILTDQVQLQGARAVQSLHIKFQEKLQEFQVENISGMILLKRNKEQKEIDRLKRPQIMKVFIYRMAFQNQ